MENIQRIAVLPKTQKAPGFTEALCDEKNKDRMCEYRNGLGLSDVRFGNLTTQKAPGAMNHRGL